MTNPASTKQIEFITTLLKERDISEAERNIYQGFASQADLSTQQASNIISTLLGKPRTIAASSKHWELRRKEEQDAFEDVENSYYAVPTPVLHALRFHDTRNDYQFFRVYTYKGMRYLRKLSGSPGYFRTMRLGRDDQFAVLALLAGHHVQYAQAFGEVFARCGRCAAPLTDKRSREIHLGPDCRKLWGIS